MKLGQRAESHDMASLAQRPRRSSVPPLPLLLTCEPPRVRRMLTRLC